MPAAAGKSAAAASSRASTIVIASRLSTNRADDGALGRQREHERPHRALAHAQPRGEDHGDHGHDRPDRAGPAQELRSRTPGCAPTAFKQSTSAPLRRRPT